MTHDHIAEALIALGTNAKALAAVGDADAARAFRQFKHFADYAHGALDDNEREGSLKAAAGVIAQQDAMNEAAWSAITAARDACPKGA